MQLSRFGEAELAVEVARLSSPFQGESSYATVKPAAAYPQYSLSGGLGRLNPLAMLITVICWAETVAVTGL